MSLTAGYKYKCVRHTYDKLVNKRYYRCEITDTGEGGIWIKLTSLIIGEIYNRALLIDKGAGLPNLNTLKEKNIWKQPYYHQQWRSLL